MPHYRLQIAETLNSGIQRTIEVPDLDAAILEGQRYVDKLWRLPDYKECYPFLEEVCVFNDETLSWICVWTPCCT